MFGKKNLNDPEKALNNAEKKLNKGITGFAAKAFMGKDNMERLNQGLAMGHEAVDMQKASAKISQNGILATAKVISIQDTGQLVNFNPIVIMQLEVTPQMGGVFPATTKTVVSKIAVPRVGDTINIKYSAADPTQIVIV